MPSSWLRIWTIVTHYHNLVVRLIKHYSKNELNKDKPIDYRFITCSKFNKLIFPTRHGAHGNALTQILLFSRGYWLKFFKNYKFQDISVISNNLFYTGYHIFIKYFNFKLHKILSKIFGPSAYIYIMYN